MKRLFLMASIILLWASTSLAFSGGGGIWEMKKGDFISKNEPGDSVGIRQGTVYLDPAGVMQLHPGVYLLGNEIGLPDSIEIRGTGPGKTILKHSGSTLHRMFSATRKKKIVLRDLTIDGDMLNVSSYPADRWDRVSALDFQDCEDVELDNVEIRMTRGNAIHGSRLIRFKLTNSWIHDTDGWGSIISGGADVTYEGNQLERIWGHGLTVDSYTAGSAWYQGIKGSRRVRFLNNTILTVFRNPLHVDEAAGIVYHEGDSTGVFDGLIQGNFVKDSEALGISLSTGDRNDGYGDSKIKVALNTVEGTLLNSGIGLELIGTNFTVATNIFKNNKYDLTMQDARNISITGGNQFIHAIGSDQVAAIISPAGVTDDVQDVTFSDNQLFGGTGFQIAAVATTRRHSGIQVNGNTFRWCEKPVLVQALTDKMKVSANIIDGDTVGVVDGRGILLWGNDLEVSTNQINCKSTAVAISFGSGSANGLITLHNNTITKADKAIDFNAGATEVQMGGNRASGITTATVEDLLNCSTVRDEGTNSWNHSNAAPSTEGWKAGQRVWHTVPTSQGNAGWVCTSSGTPGTWIEFGHNFTDTNSPAFGSATIAGNLTFSGAGAHLITATDATSSVRINAAGGVQRLEANSSGIDIAQRLVVADSSRTGLETIPGFRLFAALGTPSNGTITYCGDCTAASPTAGGGTGNIVARENGAWNALRSGTGTGETNTASNVGTGVGLVFKQKTGVDLEFKRFAAGSNVSITNGTSDLTVALPSSIALADTVSAQGGRFDLGLYVGGAKIDKILRYTAVLNFDLTTVSSQDLTISAPGVVSGDQVSLGPPSGSVSADTMFFAWVSAGGTVTVRAMRTCASAPDPGSGTFEVTVFH